MRGHERPPGIGDCGTTRVLVADEREGEVTRRLISSGSTFEQQIGYSRAVVDGDWVFVSGTTGFDYATMTISDDLLVQADQCLRNIEAALRAADASLGDVVRVGATVFRDGHEELSAAVRFRAAGTRRWREVAIESEVTARRRSGG